MFKISNFVVKVGYPLGKEVRGLYGTNLNGKHFWTLSVRASHPGYLQDMTSCGFWGNAQNVGEIRQEYRFMNRVSCSLSHKHV